MLRQLYLHRLDCLSGQHGYAVPRRCCAFGSRGFLARIQRNDAGDDRFVRLAIVESVYDWVVDLRLQRYPCAGAGRAALVQLVAARSLAACEKTS